MHTEGLVEIQIEPTTLVMDLDDHEIVNAIHDAIISLEG
jgi:hypothetical protein